MSLEQSILGKELPIKEKIGEVGRYKMVVSCYGIYNNFLFGEAQKGDPKGSVKLTGPDVNVKIGNRLFPINLDSFDNIEKDIKNAIRDKYQRDLDYGILHHLACIALRPYINFSTRFY